MSAVRHKPNLCTTALYSRSVRQFKRLARNDGNDFVHAAKVGDSDITCSTTTDAIAVAGEDRSTPRIVIHAKSFNEKCYGKHVQPPRSTR